MIFNLQPDDLDYWIIDWLSKRSPAYWHGLAIGWNWDDGVTPLHWIVQQPACDRATAALIFWLSSPDFHLKNEKREHYDGEELVFQIIDRWRSGQYVSGNFSFGTNELNLGGGGMNEFRREVVKKFKLPSNLAHPVTGTKAVPLIDGGLLPKEIYIFWHNATGKKDPDFFEMFEDTWRRQKEINKAFGAS
jgi:hypothetical protein